MREQKTDHHTALRTEILEKVSLGGIEFLLAKLQYSKDDIAYSLHADPSSFSLSGLQTPHLLQMLGFSKEACAFMARRECFAAWVSADFPLRKFAEAFPAAFSQLEGAERHLSRFELLMPGRPASRHGGGDGHTSPSSQELRRADDHNFLYVLSWLEGGRHKGWTFHNRPTHPPLSPEVQAAIRFLDLSPFSSCPYYEFEGCHWQFFPFRHDDSSISRGNAQVVHDTFAQLSEHFSPGIQAVTTAHSLLVPFGFSLLDVSVEPLPAASRPQAIAPQRSRATRQHDYDVAISFAGPQRPVAEALANLVRQAGYTPFFDAFYPEQLWGKDLVAFFDEIYRTKSRYCVIFISEEYRERMWTNHERQSAQARALAERGKEYILPIRVDQADLPGLPPTIGYVSLADHTVEQIADLLVKKLQAA